MRAGAVAAGALALLAAACSSREKTTRYVGEGTAVVDPRGRADERRTKTEPAEEVGVRRLDDGRIELVLDDCTLTTAALAAGRADIPAGSRCVARRLSAEAEIIVREGSVTLDEGAGTLTIELVGDGSASRLGENIAVRYRYDFSGRTAPR